MACPSSTPSTFNSGKILLKTIIAASFANEFKSAPTNPWVTLAISFNFTSLPNGMFLVWIFKISCLPSLSGTPISISRSNRPGLLNAGSSKFGMLVAAMTMTFPLLFNPSINPNNWATTLFSTSPLVSSLLVAMASISSKKIIAGAFCSASSNFFLKLASDSP